MFKANLLHGSEMLDYPTNFKIFDVIVIWSQLKDCNNIVIFALYYNMASFYVVITPEML